MSGGTLIVGASHAGAELAARLREEGYTGGITLVGAESQLPYQRPPLSKALLAGAVEAASLQLRTATFYRQRGIQLVLGERVTHLDGMAQPAGGVAHTDQGRRLRFDRLALTTGARPRALDVPGADLPGVCHLRDIGDALRLRTRLASARQAVVVGGGFIGLETAAVAASLGVSVTVVEAGDRLMARAVAPVLSEFYLRAHHRRGVGIRLGAGVRAILGPRDGVAAVELTDGTVLPADVVVVGIGIVPRTELAEQVGLACAGGILVDELARTCHPAVVAAGDCTVVEHPGRGRLRLESVPNAIAQARAAAAVLAGTPYDRVEVPWFWSDQFDLKLQMAGLADSHDTTVVRGDPASERFSVLYYRDGALLAVHAVNRPADYVAARAALARRATIPAETAARTDLSLKQLITAPVAGPASP